MITDARANLRWLDWLLLVELIALTFLLGCFLDQDTDIWWHLRAGRDILNGTGIPRTDSYLFAARGAEWIDLHWGFQIAAWWLFSHDGFAALTIGAALAAALAVILALAATAGGRSKVAVVWCWLPAVFVVSARFFPRPEIVSLVCLAAFLCILDRADRKPALLWLLVPIQIVWINAHSLFVLGWVLLGCWLVDRAVAGAMSRTLPDWRHRWGAPVAVIAAAFLNPYTWKGVIFPATLFRRMSIERDFYGRHIGELMSIPDVVRQTGISSAYLRLSLLLLLATAASFALRRLRTSHVCYRLLIFLLFAGLGLIAVRNQPQFALVAGAVLAWNVGDWLADRARSSFVEQAVARILTSAVLVGAILAVATGNFYAYAGEGRLVGLGEHPLWFAHDAARFAAREGMPNHFVAYHEGQAAVLEFHMRPEQRVFVDPRLEVSPRSALEQYYGLAEAAARRQSGWQDQFGQLPQPLGLLVDHESHHALEASLITDPNWRCLWFDAVAAVYVPTREADLAARPIDFGEWYFTRRAGESHAARSGDVVEATREQLHESESFYKVGRALLDVDPARTGLGRVLLLLSAANARDLTAIVPDSPRIMQLLAKSTLGIYVPPRSETLSGEWPVEVVLGLARARYFLNRAQERAPRDFQVAAASVGIAQALGDPDALWVAGSRLASLSARTSMEYEVQRQVRLMLRGLLGARAAEMPPLPPVTVPELVASARELAATRQFLRALDTIESFLRDMTSDAVPWELADLRAKLFLLAGSPVRAREVWTENAKSAVTRAALDARLATTYFVEGRVSEAADAYRHALVDDPDRAASHYGLAISGLELGDASTFVGECRAASTSNDLPAELSEFCRDVTALAAPYARQ